jgi:DNA-binding response OmpR family regulator
VEDDVDLRRMFKAALSFARYDVVEAGDGLEALRLLDNHDVDLVVLDLGLPLISGQVVLQEVAAHAQRRQVPTMIVVTGIPGPHDLPQADCVLMKPLTPERLVAAVRSCLASGSRPPVV